MKAIFFDFDGVITCEKKAHPQCCRISVKKRTFHMRKLTRNIENTTRI